MKKADEEI